MINMNSPVVQNIMQSGFNPYNNGYVPQQQPIYSGYNPYIANKKYQEQNELEWTYSYDPMPRSIVNKSRGINSTIQPVNRGYSPYNNGYNNYTFNANAFNGYMNPYLMRNQMEANKIKQREEAIQQGKIWRAFLKNDVLEDETFNIDDAVKTVESFYYHEPAYQEIPIKEKIVIDKNNHIAEIEARMEYYRQNNIPIVDNMAVMRNNFYAYYNHINSVIEDPDNCDMYDYFTRVYPTLKQEQLAWEAERFNKNLKNKYTSGEFNKILDKATADRGDSYYSKLMNSFAEDGVKLTNGDGLTITADEMEIKLPDRLLQKNQSKYYEQRRKFFDSIFKKEQ